MYRVGHKNAALYFCPCLRQLMTDFQNSFTDTLCGQFAIIWLLYILPHRKCISTLPCEIWMKYACITIITNKHFDKVGKTLQINILVNDLYVSVKVKLTVPLLCVCVHSTWKGHPQNDLYCVEWDLKLYSLTHSFCMTLDCVGLTQSSVIRIIHCNVGLKSFSFT